MPIRDVQMSPQPALPLLPDAVPPLALPQPQPPPEVDLPAMPQRLVEDGSESDGSNDTIVYDLEAASLFPFPNRETAEIILLLARITLSQRETQTLLAFLRKPLQFERVPRSLSTIAYIRGMIPQLPLIDIQLSQVSSIVIVLGE